MKYVLTVVLLSLAFAPTAGMAQKLNADDVKWINRCIDDNKGEAGATPQIVRTYCTCMNDKMDDNETQSVTQWEKSHPAERKACEKQAGWK